MNHHFYFCNAMLVEFGHFEGEVLEVDAFVKLGEVTLDFQ